MTDKEKKKCKYMISILGEQILDDESDRIEVLTEGNFLMKKDHCYIGYKEYDEDAPQSFYDNLIKVQDNTVTITRKGPMSSQLMLEKGRRHQCLYQTPAVCRRPYDRSFHKNNEQLPHPKRRNT